MKEPEEMTLPELEAAITRERFLQEGAHTGELGQVTRRYYLPELIELARLRRNNLPVPWLGENDRR